MADAGSQSAEGSCVLDYTTLFSNGIGDVLERLDDECETDVMHELMEDYDMSALMDMRLKVFRYAKRKLVSELEKPGDVDMGPVKKMLPSPGHCNDIQFAVGEWVLVAKRGKQKVVKDTMDLMGFMTGRNPFFPHAVVRRRKAKTRKKGVSRRLSRDANQPKISFEVLEDEMEGSEESQDDSVGENGDESGSTSGEMSQSENDENDVAKGPAGHNAPSDSSMGVEVPEREGESLGECIISIDDGDGVDSIPPEGEHHKGRPESLGTTDNTPSAVPDVSMDTTCSGDPSRGKVVDPSVSNSTAQGNLATAGRVTAGDIHPQTGNSTKTIAGSAAADSTSDPERNQSAVVMATQTEWDLWGSPQGIHDSLVRINAQDTSGGQSVQRR